MNDIIRILFVEDLPTDYELAKREIKKGDIDFISIRVDEKESFLNALIEFKPDIIVSDYSMPAFNGLQTIKLANEFNPILPVIILTGSLNEYTAVECIKSGAVDYVIKESMTRLPFAVIDALKVKKMKEEQLVASQALLESEERYRRLYDSMMDAYAVFSMDGFIIQWNKSFENMLGYNGNEFPTLNMYNITPEHWHHKEREIINNQVLNLGYSDVYEKEFLRKDGNIFPVELRTFLIKDLSGKPTGMWSIVRDITERKLFEDQLRTMQMATEQSPSAILITDPGGMIEFANSAFCIISGYNYNNSIGKSFTELNFGRNLPISIDELWNILVSGSEWRGEYINTNKDGTEYWGSTLFSTIKDHSGKIVHILIIQEDVTERKKNEIELRNAKEKAEEMNKLKSNFLANMSHELRTPLVGMLGFSELLEINLRGNDKKYAQMIYTSGQRLLKTLNTILNYSKIESERIQINLKKVSVTNLINDELKLFEALAKINGLWLKGDFGEKDLIVETDERMLKEIIDNLLNNAIRFTNKGGVNISLVTNTDNYIISVQDTGIGIPKDKLQIIFEEFRQVSEGKGRNFEGTGLGLTIVKKYVTALGGSIKLISEEDIGSTFSVILPLIKVNSNIITSVKTANDFNNRKNNIEGKYSVLIVEDDYISSLAVQQMLTNNFVITSVSNGEDAIKKSEQEVFDIILMDINLKYGINGIEAAQRIRKINGYQNTPIVAMTAYVMNEDKKDFLDSGCSHYIPKPFNQADLLGLLLKITNGIIKR